MFIQLFSSWSAHLQKCQKTGEEEIKQNQNKLNMAIYKHQKL
jgi:hypothetical protein